MKTMLAKFPNRERISIGISVDVFLCLVLGSVLLCYFLLFFNDMQLVSVAIICMCSTHFARLELFTIADAYHRASSSF